MDEEGWYVDPYGAHAARWFRDGTPTDLVQDGGLPGKDAPPETPFVRPLVPFIEDGPTDGHEFRRAEDEPPAEDAIWDEFLESGND